MSSAPTISLYFSPLLNICITATTFYLLYQFFYLEGKTASGIQYIFHCHPTAEKLPRPRSSRKADPSCQPKFEEETTPPENPRSGRRRRQPSTRNGGCWTRPSRPREPRAGPTPPGRRRSTRVHQCFICQSLFIYRFWVLPYTDC